MGKTWDEYLVFEHEMIERAIEVMKQELTGLSSGSRPSVRLKRAVDFLLEFGDKMHNRKEEDYLFPLMEQRGIPRQGGPIAVMLKEHEMERELLGRFSGLLSSSEALSSQQLDAMKKEAADYMRIRAEHIWKENDVLYAMGRKVLSSQDAASLVDDFKRFDRAVYGDDYQDKFTAMLEEAESGARKKRLIENLSYDQLHAIMETLPVEVTFVDAEDTVAYFNRLDKDKVFVRTRSVIGRKVEMCHPKKSVDKVKAIVQGFKDGTLDSADFWIDFKGDKVLIRYFPVRDDHGKYMGVLEVTQEIGWIQKLKGQKVLLDG